MKNSDKLLTLKDWINYFWDFQEEDLKYFEDLITQKIPPEPEKILSNLRERIQKRRAFYQIYKHLPWRDLSLNDLIWVEQKLTQIVYREELITELINKILDILSKAIECKEILDLEIPSNRILH